VDDAEEPEDAAIWPARCFDGKWILIFVAGSRAPHAAPEIHAAFSAKEQATGVVSSRPLCLGNGWGRGGGGMARVERIER